MKSIIIAAFCLLAGSASAAEIKVTEIRQYEPKGIRLVGPLPAAIQNYTIYEAALMTGATADEAARAILLHLATPAAKAAFTADSVE